MATLSANTSRAYAVDVDGLETDHEVIASDIIYEGAAVGNSSGRARPLVAADSFMGFALRKADNSSGSAGDVSVRVAQQGVVELAITGVTGVGDLNSTVYASDDDTFTLTSTGNTSIGKVIRYISGTTCDVFFQANGIRSL